MKVVDSEKAIALLEKAKKLLPGNNGILPQKYLSKDGMDVTAKMAAWVWLTFRDSERWKRNEYGRIRREITRRQVVSISKAVSPKT